MKKRVLAGIMMAVMMMASVMSVSAAGSKTQEVYPSGERESFYTTDASEGVFSDLATDVQDIIKELNANKTTSLSADIQKTLSGKTLIADVFDLEPHGTHAECEANGHKVQLTVTTLTENCKNIVVLHYSEGRNVWETVEPTSVDYKNKTITVVLKDLSPVGIYAEVSGSGATGSSPATVGTSSTWMMWAALALVVVGAGVVVSQKKSR